MSRTSSLKLIDILSLQPGALLHLHAVSGEPACNATERLLRAASWKQQVSSAIFPNGDTQKRHNLSKLLDIGIDTHILVKYPDGKVIELFRLDERTWDDLRSRVGQSVDVMIDGRIFAQGEIVDEQGLSGILIKKLMSA